jgi:starvation-inducible outer membrane lipoprotein
MMRNSGQFKIMANSPNELNPTQLKIVPVQISSQSDELLSTAANTGSLGRLMSYENGFMTPLRQKDPDI